MIANAGLLSNRHNIDVSQQLYLCNHF